MFENVALAMLGVVGAYFLLSFLITLLVVGCGFYFVWRITR